MLAKLIATDGPMAGREFELPPDQDVLLGRLNADVVVTGDEVSRKHCCIDFCEGFYVVEDLGSKNGTWVNGKAVKNSVLFDGDVLRVGEQPFRFELHPEAAEAGGVKLAYPEPARYSQEVKERVELQDATSVMETLVASLPAETARQEGEVPMKMDGRLGALCRIIDVVQGFGDLEELFEGIMNVIMEVSEADRGYLIAAEQAGDPIEPVVARFRRPVPQSLRGSYSRTMVNECYEGGCAILRADPLTSGEDISKSILHQGIHSIMCVPLPSERGPVGVIYVDRLLPNSQFDKKDLQVLAAMGNQAGIAINRAQLTRRAERLFRGTIQTVINVIEVKDKYTRGHSERVMEMGLLVGELLDMNRDQLRTVRLAGLLHDVGKIGVSALAIKKPGKLTDDEFELMKQHPVVGARVIGSIENAEEIAAVVRNHHEKWDGSGYPEGFAGEDIPVIARVLAIADSWDAMYADRVYREALSEDECLCEIEKGAGSQFDPRIASIFVQSFRNDEDFCRRVREIYTVSEESQ